MGWTASPDLYEFVFLLYTRMQVCHGLRAPCIPNSTLMLIPQVLSLNTFALPCD